MAQADPGAVELAVQAEVAGLAVAASRPALVAAAVALAKVLDGPVTAAYSKASAARVLAALVDKLHSAPVPGRHRKLAAVRTLTGGTHQKPPPDR